VARDDDQDGEDAATPWHHSTAKVFGASVAAIAGVGLIVGAVAFVSGQADEPTQAPLNFVDPSFSATQTTASNAPTSSTSASKLPNPQTTDIDLPPPSETPPTPSSSPTAPGPPTQLRPPRTKEDTPDDDESGPTTTRNRPRFNETRTLYPQP
jgi:hypothetical protein